MSDKDKKIDEALKEALSQLERFELEDINRENKDRTEWKIIGGEDLKNIKPGSWAANELLRRTERDKDQSKDEDGVPPR